jgi:hypothetical protein
MNAPSQQAPVTTDALAYAVRRLNADASFQQAWQADPWLALACYDLIPRPASHALSPAVLIDTSRQR